jgi:hypothetical protein
MEARNEWVPYFVHVVGKVIMILSLSPEPPPSFTNPLTLLNSFHKILDYSSLLLFSAVSLQNRPLNLL